MCFLLLVVFLCMTSLSGVTSQDVCEMRAMLSRLNAVERQLEEQQMEINNLKADRQGTYDTFFLATLRTTHLEVPSGSFIVFDKVINNTGGHYNPHSGIYTVPYHGLYLITVTKHSDEKSCDFEVFIDDKPIFYYRLVTGTGGTGTPSGSVTFNLELTKDQIIRVKNHVSKLVHGYDDKGHLGSFFGGFMLLKL